MIIISFYAVYVKNIFMLTKEKYCKERPFYFVLIVGKLKIKYRLEINFKISEKIIK